MSLALTNIDVLRHGWDDAVSTVTPDLADVRAAMETGFAAAVRDGCLDEASLLAIVHEIVAVAARQAGGDTGRLLSRALQRAVYEYLLSLDALTPQETASLEQREPQGALDPSRLIGFEEVAELEGRQAGMAPEPSVEDAPGAGPAGVEPAGEEPAGEESGFEEPVASEAVSGRIEAEEVATAAEPAGDGIAAAGDGAAAPAEDGDEDGADAGTEAPSMDLGEGERPGAGGRYRFRLFRRGARDAEGETEDGAAAAAEPALTPPPPEWWLGPEAPPLVLPAAAPEPPPAPEDPLAAEPDAGADPDAEAAAAPEAASPASEAAPEAETPEAEAALEAEGMPEPGAPEGSSLAAWASTESARAADDEPSFSVAPRAGFHLTDYQELLSAGPGPEPTAAGEVETAAEATYIEPEPAAAPAAGQSQGWHVRSSSKPATDAVPDLDLDALSMMLDEDDSDVEEPAETTAAVVEARSDINDRLRRRRCDDAAAMLQKLATDVGGRSVAELALDAGDRCRALGKGNAALSCYLAASRADPVLEGPLMRLADICLDDHDIDLAVSYLDRVARLHRARGDTKGALRLYRKIATIAPYRDDILATLMRANSTGQFED